MRQPRGRLIPAVLAGLAMTAALGNPHRAASATTNVKLDPVTEVAMTPPPLAPTGYWVLGADGGVFTFGGVTFEGSAVPLHPPTPVVAAAATRSGHGYWLVTSDGGVFTFGDARFFGSASGAGLGTVIGIVATPSEDGYWLVTTTGRIANYGDAPPLSVQSGPAPVVAVARTPSGHGLWLAQITGAVVDAGDAPKLARPDHGPESARPLVGIAPTPSGQGYWLSYLDGAIATVGDARPLGSLAGVALAAPVVGLVSTSDGAGLLQAATDGGVFRFGTAPYAGSTASSRPATTIIGVLLPGSSTSAGTALLLGYLTPKTFSLTFDDGPNPQFTQQVLNVLIAKQVLATFFEIGRQIEASPEITEAVARAGDIVGNHTYSHPFLTRVGPSQFNFELDRTTQLIAQVVGRAPRCVRPPSGDTNPSVAARIAQRGFKQQLWTVDPSDYRRPPPGAIVANVLANAAPGGVVVMHDGGGDRSNTVAALPAIIDGLRAAGFTLVPACS